MIEAWTILKLTVCTWQDGGPQKEAGSSSNHQFSGVNMLVSGRVLLGGAFKYFFIFTPILGEMIQFDDHIFHMGWNHQPVYIQPL